MTEGAGRARIDFPARIVSAPYFGPRSWGKERTIALDQKPPRVVGLTGAILMNLNAVIGSGIFALPALLFAAAGTFSSLAILTFAVLYASLMAVVAKLTTVFRQSGGHQLFAEHAFGKAVGFQAGWLSVLANMAGASANFHVLVSYLAAIFPFFADPLMRLASIAVLIATFTAISMSGTARAVRLIGIGTVLKLSPLALLCVVGFATNGFPTEVELPRFSEFESIALLLAFAFSGADLAIAAAGEMKNPRRMMRRAIFTTLGGVAVFYALIQWAYIAIAPDPGEVDAPLAAAAQVVMGDWGALMISCAAIISVTVFQLNVFVAIPRIFYGMARRGLLPSPIAFVSPRFQTPVAAIGMYGGIIALLALSGSFEALAVLLVSVEQTLFAMSITALVVMWQRNDAGLRRAMDARWLFILPFASGVVLWLLSKVSWDAALSTALYVGVGFVLYVISRRSGVEHEGIDLPEARA